MTRWDLVTTPLKLIDKSLDVPRPIMRQDDEPVAKHQPEPRPPIPLGVATPKGSPELTASLPPEPRVAAKLTADIPNMAPKESLAPDPAELNRDEDSATTTSGLAKDGPGQSRLTRSSRTVEPLLPTDRRIRPEQFDVEDTNRAGTRLTIVPDRGTRNPARAKDQTTAVRGPKSASPGAAQGARTIPMLSSNVSAAINSPIPLTRATPKALSLTRGDSGLAAIDERRNSPNLTDVPRIYQPRLLPNRSTRAQRSGASAASELAVERALDWLARHQDDDGRWDGGIARYEDGTPVKNDDDFTVHCPPGETCFGICAYWDADTALTGLALLTFLGAGYTHTDGRYADVVGKGFEFLLEQQKPDGDLRGASRVVGMYCHAMATLALCEAFALTGDVHLRDPAERAIQFQVRARARDDMAWRYAPGAPTGDTSILGWVVMGLKSAREVGIPIPGEQSVRRGTLLWLDRVATGQAKGLARYQPWEPVTPTMTAEAWVCRQFLGVGGPGPASTEAAESLLQNDSDRGSSNVYYWYYATLALYQHGGEPWSRWNAKIRDRIVALQCSTGHQTGSWEPDKSPYGATAGRIYSTTLATLTLEVYYRYLRLYDEPKIPLEADGPTQSQPRRGEPSLPAAASSSLEKR
jgi:hypothetical protein